MIIALFIFILTYIEMFALPKYRHLIALITAIIFVMISILPIDQVLSVIDFNVILMILGTMGTVSLFISSKMPDLIADYLIKRAQNIKWMTVILAAFAGIISAFIDNVATVLIIAPIVLTISKKANINPTIPIICIAIFSNLEGAATLTGDTTSFLLAKELNMNFLDFFTYHNKIGLFFIIQISLISSLVILYFKQRKETKKVVYHANVIVNDYMPTILLITSIIGLIIASFIEDKMELTNGLICTGIFMIGLILTIIKKRSLKPLSSLKDIDYETIILLISLFIIIGGIKNVGVIDYISQIFINLPDNNFIIYSLIVLVSVVISSFVDNIPYVATMLPVITTICNNTNINPLLLYYGLIIGATLGGNFTPIGASSNITAIGLLKKNGYNISNKTYFSYSIPISLAAILTSYLIVWILFKTS